MISWLLSTSLPARRANVRESVLMSAKDTSAIAMAAINKSLNSAMETAGI